MDTKGTNLISVRLCYFLFHFFFIIPSNAITDTLLQGQQLRSSDQLFSANGYYRLGFFSPRHAVSQHWGTAKFYNFPRQYLGSFYGYEKPYLKIFSSQPDSGYSSRYAEPQYLGIFYNYANEDGQKAVWVANRNTPISDRSGRLVIDEYGNMKILQAGVNPPVVLCSVDGRVNASATLLDTGNFILRELTSDGSTKRILWQSFDYPTDTLLPGMKLGINKTGLTWSLTSWISDDNPASGSFTLGGDPKGTNQLIIYRQGEIYWKSGLWINGKFELVPQLSPDYYHRFSYISNGNEKYFNFSTSKDYAFPRYTIESTGRVSESTGSTIFGACDSSYNPDAGCMKKKLPECRDPNTDFYEKLSFIYSGGVEFDNSHNLSLFDCQAKCLNDCSCVAYASVNEDITGCEIWSKEMEIIDAYRDSDPTARSIHVLHKRIDAEEVSDLKEDLWTIWLIIAAAGVPVILMLCSLFHLIRKKHKVIDNIKTGLWALASVVKEWGVGVRLVFKYYIANIKRRQEMLISMDKLSRDGKKSPELRFFSYKSLASATNKFATRNELGKGGFGPVYKGILQNGQEIAIKRLSRNSGQGLTEFKNELTLIARLQHINLVRLVGCCIQRKEMMLIYEYMPNKSLDFFLFDPMRRTLLDWKKRFEIIQGIAQGLLYLHKYSRLRLIHRDLKAGNILLDDEMNPKISDFGMARIFEQNESKANTNRIAGTYGYMSPEYAMEGICSLKSDVFSFGVLLLEIVSGTKNNSYYQPEQPLNLTGHAWELWKEGRYLELMDPTLENSYDNNEVLRCIHVGLLCVQDNPIDRPTMSDVTALIRYESIPLSAPKQPAFFIHKSLSGAEIVEQRLEVFSSNRVSITEMEAR